MARPMAEIYKARIAEGGLYADPAQEAVLPEFDRIAQALAAAPSRGVRSWFGSGRTEVPKGLYLWGGVGRGKSMLMDMFYAAAGTDRKRRVHFHAFMQEIQSALHEARKTGVDDALKPVAEDVTKDLRLLCLDEMQVTDIADAMILGRLFQRFFDAGLAVVTTSNRPPRDLYKDGLNRKLFLPFIDLLNERMVVWHLESPKDYRQGQLLGAQVYFHPADAEAKAAIDAIWHDIAGEGAEPLTLKVKGRDVTLPRFKNGVGRASFWELCGRPLGPADYLAIAEAVRVLVLEDIPRLSSENYNEARRFVTLVDALYEAKTRLIASAADRPEGLYIEGEGSFEFERTASRLREMQSDRWAAA